MPRAEGAGRSRVSSRLSPLHRHHPTGNMLPLVPPSLHRTARAITMGPTKTERERESTRVRGKTKNTPK